MSKQMKIVVITNCTATQTVKAPKELHGSNLPTGLTSEETCDEWVKRLNAYKDKKYTPAELYRGVSFYTVTQMQQYLSGDHIFVVSIGQGLVGYRQPITPYDLSIVPKHVNGLPRVVTAEPFSPTHWWALINEKLYGADSIPAITTRMKKLTEEADLIIVACTNQFLTLIGEDLLYAASDEDILPKLRIISVGTPKLPKQLAPLVLQYDKRINVGTAGNRNNANQRAVLHFLRLLSQVENPYDDLETHREMVATALDKIGPTTKRFLVRDEEGIVTKYLDENADSLKGKNPDRVYEALKKSRKIQMSNKEFRRAWRRKFGLRSGRPLGQPPKKVAKTQSAAAVTALNSILGQLSKQHEKTATYEDETNALETLQIFGQILRENQPEAQFTSTEVFSWVQGYYGELEETLPPLLGSVGKLSHLLRNYYEELGFEAVGKRSYKLRSNGVGTDEIGVDEVDEVDEVDTDEIDTDV